VAGGLTPSGGAPRRRGFMPMSEINVTPFVDVMLVLLIIFMVTAPLLTSGVAVDLPRTNAQPLTDAVEPVVITVDSDGRIFVQEAEVEATALVPRLLAVTNENPDARIYVRGDRAIEYGRVMEVMGLVSQAGFVHVALVAIAPPSGLGAGGAP
jgi:biopolymer transport protein TolR